MLTFCPLVPLNVRLAFCPGTVVATETGDPPMLIVPVTSAGTVYSCSVSLPTYVLMCCTHSVYVPVVASVCVSMKHGAQPVEILTFAWFVPAGVTRKMYA